MPNFIPLEIHFSSGTKFFWNEEWILLGMDIECVLLGRNFDFFDGYFGRYCSLPSGY